MVTSDSDCGSGVPVEEIFDFGPVLQNYDLVVLFMVSGFPEKKCLFLS